jgi:urease subunit beta
MIPGEIFITPGELELNPGKKKVTISVVNTGDRPIQIGSHYHFAATNPALEFDRNVALGMRLNIIAGTSARFEPGMEKSVELVDIGGARFIPGLRGEHPDPLPANNGGES